MVLDPIQVAGKASEDIWMALGTAFITTKRIQSNWNLVVGQNQWSARISIAAGNTTISGHAYIGRGNVAQVGFLTVVIGNNPETGPL